MVSIIPIFKDEKEIADQIRSNASIAYCCPIEKFNIDPILKASIDESLSIAGQEDPDLYHTLSVLVTTAWNKNDDIFLPEEVWSARKTPEHKQTNIDHNDDKIVGHIIGNWPVDDNYKLLKEDLSIDELPGTFHILTASVIYKQRSNPETLAEVKELIEAIESGNRFVSMECVFRGFDYAVNSVDGTNYVITRASDTAFLTKHLRAYGGTGEYEGHKIGRLLRRITFSGKGYVEKPANPFSIIFDKKNLSKFDNVIKNNAFLKNGVISTSNEVVFNERFNMSEHTALESQISELKASLKEAEKTNAELKEKLVQVGAEKFEKEIKQLNTTKEQLESDLSKVNADLKEVNDKLTKTAKDLKEKTDSHDKLKEELDKIKLQAIKADRVASLVDAGVDKELAQKKVDLYANLNDEQFEAVSQDIIKAVVASVENKDESDDSSNADQEVIDTAKPNTEPTMATVADEDKLESTRADLAKWVASELGYAEVK